MARAEPERQPAGLTVMRRTWRFLAAMAVIVTGLLVSPQAACACSCIVATEAESAARADTVFIGVVTSELSGNRFSFTVEQMLKGEPKSTITLTTPSGGGAACGVEFAKGERLQVYATDGHTNLCSGNKLLLTGGATDPATPTSAPAGLPLGWVAAGGAVLVAGFALLLLRRFKKGGQPTA